MNIIKYRCCVLPYLEKNQFFWSFIFQKKNIKNKKKSAKKKILPTYLPYFFSGRYRKHTIFLSRPNATRIGILGVTFVKPSGANTGCVINVYQSASQVVFVTWLAWKKTYCSFDMEPSTCSIGLGKIVIPILSFIGSVEGRCL